MVLQDISQILSGEEIQFVRLEKRFWRLCVFHHQLWSQAHIKAQDILLGSRYLAIGMSIVVIVRCEHKWHLLDAVFSNRAEYRDL